MATRNFLRSRLSAECGLRGVRIEVEELVALVTDEVVAAAWAATGNADGLREGEAGFERGVIDGRYAVEAETDAEDD